MTIVITNVGADFTRLGSFGDAEQFGGNVVAQMDRSYLNRSWNKPKSPVQVLLTFMSFVILVTEAQKLTLSPPTECYCCLALVGLQAKLTLLEKSMSSSS